MTPEEIEKHPYRPSAGVMVMNAEGNVFAAQRIDSTYDAWQMPQGGIEKGEDPHAAALRELEEETGIPPRTVTLLATSADWIAYDLPQNLVPRIWGGRYRGQKQRWFLMRFTGDDALINIETAHPEFSRWSWLPPEEVLARIVPFKRATYARVIEEFRPYFP